MKSRKKGWRTGTLKTVPDKSKRPKGFLSGSLKTFCYLAFKKKKKSPYHASTWDLIRTVRKKSYLQPCASPTNRKCNNMIRTVIWCHLQLPRREQKLQKRALSAGTDTTAITSIINHRSSKGEVSGDGMRRRPNKDKSAAAETYRKCLTLELKIMRLGWEDTGRKGWDGWF